MNEKLSKYIDKARELRNYSEEMAPEELETTEIEPEVDEEDEGDADKKGNKYRVDGIVKKIATLTDKDESGSAEIVAVVRIPSAKAFNVMGKNIKMPSGAIIPVVTANASVGYRVTLEFDINKLTFKIAEKSQESQEN